MSFSRKGISVTVSAVMLIVFTVAIAGLYGGWVKNYFTTSTEEANKEDLPKDCDKVDLEIKEVSYVVPYNTITTFQDGSVNVSLPYEGPGNQTVYVEVSSSNILDATLYVEAGYY